MQDCFFLSVTYFPIIFQEKSKENHWLIWYDNHKYTLQRNDNV